MLQKMITNFLHYCNHYQFSDNAIEGFITRLNELYRFLRLQHIESLNEITYQHFLEFVASGNRSKHVKTVQVRTLHQFFRFLQFYKFIEVNVAQRLSYPQMDKKDPEFLTLDEIKIIRS